MQSLQAKDHVELTKHLAQFGDEFLFRGQINAHNASDGLPNLNSSFVRQGCVPPLMLKWIFYTDELLRRGGFDTSKPGASHFTQGLLQHYGWRSFFVDLTASPDVAAWFASHAFAAKRGWQLCENSFEEPAMLGIQAAHYTDHADTGHLYVLSKAFLKQSKHELVSLVDELTTDSPTRFKIQKAWLAGLFLMQRRIDPAAIVAEITAPASVFRGLAASAGFKSTDDLFPPPSHDKILDNLLSLPRIKIDIPAPPFPFYLRSLEIPEYQDSFVKHLPPATVLYSPVWLSEITAGTEKELWLRVPEETFYGHTRTDQQLPRLSAFLNTNNVTNVESAGLICLPPSEGSATYKKGISVRRMAGNMFDVCAISMDYVSDRCSGSGVARGYMYELLEDRLVRRPAESDCNCGDPRRHDLHLRALAVLDDILGTAKIERTDNVVSVTL